MKKRSFLLLLGMAGLLIGCRKNCGPSGEPRLQLSINSRTPLSITEVRALGALTTAPAITFPLPYTAAQDRTGIQLTLPINLTADRTQYVLISPTRRDTMTVNYRRLFTYEDVECGYIINVASPQSNSVSMDKIVQVTTGTVQFVNFQSTVVRPFSILSNSQDTSITINLSWP